MANGDSSTHMTSIGGNVLSIPFTIEDKSTHETIKSTSLYLHISRAEYEPSDDPTFTNISITGIYQDGSFHAIITKKSLAQIFRDNATDRDWNTELNRLFPIDDVLDVEDPEDSEDLVLSAKLLALESQYDPETKDLLESDEDPNNDAIVLAIKTTAKVPVTVGSIRLQAVDLEEDTRLKDEGNLFNWMELLHGQNKALVDELLSLRKQVDSLERDNYELTTNYETSKTSHKSIVEDLEQKFYQLLDSKKEKIWNLTKHTIPQDSLQGLNTGYYKNDGSKLENIVKEEISDQLDEKYIKKRKAPPTPKLKREPRAKRQKKIKKGENDDGLVKEEPASPEIRDSTQEFEAQQDTNLRTRSSFQLSDQDILKSALGVESEADENNGDENDEDIESSVNSAEEEGGADDDDDDAYKNEDDSQDQQVPEVEDEVLEVYSDVPDEDGAEDVKVEDNLPRKTQSSGSADEISQPTLGAKESEHEVVEDSLATNAEKATQDSAAIDEDKEEKEVATDYSSDEEDDPKQENGSNQGSSESTAKSTVNNTQAQQLTETTQNPGSPSPSQIDTDYGSSSDND